MTEKDVYQFYNEKVKILYSEIEARNNSLPVTLLKNGTKSQILLINLKKNFLILQKYNGQKKLVFCIFPLHLLLVLSPE
jgi:hypothetical protein